MSGDRQVVEGAPPRAAWVLGGRLLLLALTAATCLAGLWPVSAVLLAASSAVVVRSAVRNRRRGPLDAVAVGVGGWLVAVLLVGLVLNALPGGLNRTSWALGLAAAGTAALLLGPRDPSPLVTWRGRRPRPSTVLCSLGAVLLAATALVVSVVGAGSGGASSVQLSVADPGGLEGDPGWATVLVTAGADRGPFQLTVDRGHGVQDQGGPFVVPAGGQYAAQVVVPEGVRTAVVLHRAGDPSPLRWVTLDRPSARSGPPS